MRFAKVKASALLALALAGCSTAPGAPPVVSGGPAASMPAPPPRYTAGDTFLSIIGTPFLIVLKIPACVLTAVIAAPVGAAATLADGELAWGTRRGLADGLEQNCGPPYAM
jgi:hypothetical protein